MKTWKLLVALVLVVAAIYIIPRSGKQRPCYSNDICGITYH